MRNDKLAFGGILVNENRRVLKQRSTIPLDKKLHLASKLGHTELVAEIVKLCPDLVGKKNGEQETPLHAACHHGNLEVVKLLMETDPLVATELDGEKESAFLVACREGHLDVVKFMLSQSWLMELEEAAFDSTPLHVATLRGHYAIVKEILQVRPNFALKVNKNGFSPLHCASSVGQVDIVKLLLNSDPELALQYNNYGYTPLHLAVINGYVAILQVFISNSPNSLGCLTKDGETVFHLAVRFDRYNVVLCLAQFSDFSHLLHHQDRDGNTLLHLAVSTENCQLVKYILNTTVEIDCQNDKGHSALDILEQAGRDSENKDLKEMIKKANADGSMELSPVLEQAENSNNKELKETLKTSNANGSTEFPSTMTNLEIMDPEEAERLALDEKITTLLQCRGKHKFRRIPNPRMDDNFEIGHPEISLGTNHGADALNQVNFAPSELATLKHLRKRTRKEVRERHKSRRNRQYEMHREALQNARNTIILVASLIASVTFTVGLNVPGGVNQEGIAKGQAAVARKTAFKIFVISNAIALFTSLCIVIILVSIIPFRRKKLLRLMMIAHKVMWVAVSFMATAFVAATWVILPRSHNTRWMLEAILAISASSMVTVFIYLGIQFARHWLRKSKWKKMKIVAVNIQLESQLSIEGGIQPQPEQYYNETGIESESSNSDVDSATSIGCHTY